MTLHQSSGCEFPHEPELTCPLCDPINPILRMDQCSTAGCSRPALFLVAGYGGEAQQYIIGASLLCATHAMVTLKAGGGDHHLALFAASVYEAMGSIALYEEAHTAMKRMEHLFEQAKVGPKGGPPSEESAPPAPRSPA